MFTETYKKEEIMSIIENIKAELLKMINIEKGNIVERRRAVMVSEEYYQIIGEENFLNRLEEFVESI